MTATGTARFAAPPLLPGAAPAERPPEGAGAAPFTTVPTAVVRGGGLGLSTEAKLLYVVLRSYAAPDGTCFPGYARLQADVGCGVNRLTRAVRELEAAGLVARRRRGQGKTTRYAVHAPGAPAPEGVQTPRPRGSSFTPGVTLESPLRGAEQDSGDLDPREQHQPAAPPELAPTAATADTCTSASDDAAPLVAALQARGLTPRMARQLVTDHDAQAIREQLAWQPHRPPAANPAGALVQAIRERWPAPSAWRAVQERAAATARQVQEERRRHEEEDARRQEWAAKPPEERIAGRLQFWVLGRRAKRQEPTAAEVAAKRAELLAGLQPAAGGVS